MYKDNFTFKLRDITEIGILCGLAIVLDTFIKIPVFPGTGGSVSIAMIPLIYIALHRGWFKGFIAGGIIFGLITCLIDGYGFITYPLDYLLGFGSVAIIGLFRSLIVSEKLTFKNYAFFALAILACITVRFFASLVSGMLIYELNFVDSAIYQLSYIGPTLFVLEIVLLPLLSIFVSLFKRVY